MAAERRVCGTSYIAFSQLERLSEGLATRKFVTDGSIGCHPASAISGREGLRTIVCVTKGTTARMDSRVIASTVAAALFRRQVTSGTLMEPNARPVNAARNHDARKSMSGLRRPAMRGNGVNA